MSWTGRFPALLAAATAAASLSCPSSGEPGGQNRVGTVTRLTHTDARNGQGFWSPDGERISFVSDRDGSWQVYVMNGDGSGLRRLTRVADPVGWPSWSPDGRWILFYAGQDAGYRIYRVGADGGEPSLVQDDGFADFRPSLSPDGRKLLFDRYGASDPPSHDLFVRDLESGELTPVAPHPGYDSDARWSPDGSHIAFHSDRHGSERYDTDVYVVRADGSELRRLTRQGGSYPAWSPDGSRIVYVAAVDGDRELWLVSADGGSATRLTRAPGDDQDPSWSPDGTAILFSSRRYGTSQELCLLPVDQAPEP